MHYSNVPFSFFWLILELAIASALPASQQFKFEEYDPIPEWKILQEGKTHWYQIAEETLQQNIRRAQETPRTVAKNVVIIIGDGMGIPTITAARIYKGQRKFGKSGEDHKLVYEDFPNLALVKTYNVDMQVPDSAGTATAIFSGVKTRYKSVGLDVNSFVSHFDEEIYKKSQLDGIMSWAQAINKSTGIITTTRVTHATPSATYAHVNNRDWECDSAIPLGARSQIKDIARQLVEDAPGKNYKVIMGGGLQTMGHFTENISHDEEDLCVRTDGRNLTRQWMEMHRQQGHKAAFVTTRQALAKSVENSDYLMGLFNSSHVSYELERGPHVPSLSEMVTAGLKVLLRDREGFVLLIEGGKVDIAHHKNFARFAMEEAAELDSVVDIVLSLTNPEETLVLVTADHSHSMTLNGYSKRGNDVLGYTISEEDADKKPTLTISYANGKGFDYHYMPNETNILGPWRDVRYDENRLMEPRYRHMAGFHVKDETHGGDDVALFATGPGSHLVRGVIEQNYIAHLVSYTACFGPRAGLNKDCMGRKSEDTAAIKSGSKLTKSSAFILMPMVLINYILCF